MAKYKVKEDVILNILGASVKCKKGDVLDLNKLQAEDLAAYVEKVYPRRGRKKKAVEAEE